MRMADKKPAKAAPYNAEAAIKRLQARCRNLEAWTAEVERSLAVNLNVAVGQVREDEEEAAEAAEESS